MNNLKKKKRGYGYQNFHRNHCLDTKEPGETGINNWEFNQKVCIYLCTLKSIFLPNYMQNFFSYYVFVKA